MDSGEEESCCFWEWEEEGDREGLLLLEKLLSLLVGGVSGARGRFGMVVAPPREQGGSVGRRAAGTYMGWRGCRTWRTLR